MNELSYEWLIVVTEVCGESGVHVLNKASVF